MLHHQSVSVRGHLKNCLTLSVKVSLAAAILAWIEALTPGGESLLGAEPIVGIEPTPGLDLMLRVSGLLVLVVEPVLTMTLLSSAVPLLAMSLDDGGSLLVCLMVRLIVVLGLGQGLWLEEDSRL